MYIREQQKDAGKDGDIACNCVGLVGFFCATQTFGIPDYSISSRSAHFYGIVSCFFSSARGTVLSGLGLPAGGLSLPLHSVPLSWPNPHFAAIVHQEL